MDKDQFYSQNSKLSVPLLCLIGQPVNHSLSPLIFKSLSEKFRVPLIYSKMPLHGFELEEFIQRGKKVPQFLGCNITVPYKSQVMSQVNALSTESRVVGAVNVLKYEGGRISGHNTDVYGFEEVLRESEIDIKGGSFCILGAGGAARAVAFVLARFGAREIVIVNRNKERALELAESLILHFPETWYRVFGWEEKIEWGVRNKAEQEKRWALIHTTSLGVSFQNEMRRPSFPALISFCHQMEQSPRLVLDLVYGKGSTPFLDAASALGLSGRDGLDLLIWQALGAWEIWFGKLNVSYEQKRQLKAELKAELLSN